MSSDDAPPHRQVKDDRYRAGLCVDCGTRPYSAGRPRCEACHKTYQRIMAGYDR
jgi:tRNA(Ile2) C34 agmatinyltransferase TiaS